MKKLLSSSSSSDANIMCSNSKSATAGCLAGILRRILCSGSLPTYPSDQITEETNSLWFSELRKFKAEEEIQTPSTPGLVARLMGLDSMPDVDLGSAPNSVSRSRSMNSVDCLVGCDKKQGKNHRRVKSTLSFRDVPAFVELENEEFFILSFENGNGGKEVRSKARKCEVGFGELKQRKTERSKNMGNMKKENEHEEKRKALSDLNGKEIVRKRISDKPAMKVGNNGRVRAPTTNSTPRKSSRCEKQRVAEVFNGGKSSSEKKTKINFHAVENILETECNSEDSSPVSVLDRGKFLVDPQASISGLWL